MRAFDYLIAVFLNVGYFYGETGERRDPEYFTLPRRFVQKHLSYPDSPFSKLRTQGLDLTAFKGELGFEQIARDLHVPSPSRPA